MHCARAYAYSFFGSERSYLAWPTAGKQTFTDITSSALLPHVIVNPYSTPFSIPRKPGSALSLHSEDDLAPHDSVPSRVPTDVLPEESPASLADQGVSFFSITFTHTIATNGSLPRDASGRNNETHVFFKRHLITLTTGI